MRFSIQIAFLGTAVFFAAALPHPAHAQASRTWVSGVGDDANPCSRTAPCKTFAGAISKTAANGIINCIDPGGFGVVTITKSITLDCSGTFGGILASGANGVNVNGAGINVKIRNLSIEGLGTGLIGVNILNAATVHIENCHIHGFQNGTAAGVRIATSANVQVSLADTILAENVTTTGSGAGLLIAPTGSGRVRVLAERLQSKNNGNGISAIGASGTGPVFVTIKDSALFGNSGSGLASSSTATGATIDIGLTQTLVSANLGSGLDASTRSTFVVGSSVITANNIGVQLTSGGRAFTFGNNHVSDNAGGNGSFTATVPPQ